MNEPGGHSSKQPSARKHHAAWRAVINRGRAPSRPAGIAADARHSALSGKCSSGAVKRQGARQSMSGSRYAAGVRAVAYRTTVTAIMTRRERETIPPLGGELSLPPSCRVVADPLRDRKAHVRICRARRRPVVVALATQHIVHARHVHKGSMPPVCDPWPRGLGATPARADPAGAVHRRIEQRSPQRSRTSRP